MTKTPDNINKILYVAGTLITGAIGETCTYAVVNSVLRGIDYGPGANLLLGEVGLTNLALSGVVGKLAYDSIFKKQKQSRLETAAQIGE